LAELAETIAAIGEHGVEPVAKPFFANLFFHLFDPSKFDSRGPLCFLRRHACANVFIGQHFQVGMNLLVEVYPHDEMKKDFAETFELSQRQACGTLLYDASKACAIAQETRPHRLVSA